MFGDPPRSMVDVPAGGGHAMIGIERPAASTSYRRVARKVVVAVIGATVLAFGVVLIVLPGPAVVVIPLGLAIMGKEFLWARRLLEWLRAEAHRVLRRLGWRSPTHEATSASHPTGGRPRSHGCVY